MEVYEVPLIEAKEKPTIFKVVPEDRITHFGKNYHKIHLKSEINQIKIIH